LRGARSADARNEEALTQAEEPLPVVFLTAHGDISSSVHAMKLGTVDFLTKTGSRG
jgi:FixJ family two-component response regulator